MDDKATFYTVAFDPKNVFSHKKTKVTLDLTIPECEEVRLRVGEHFVVTTPERLMECIAWLLTNVGTDTMVTKNEIAGG